MSEPDLDALPSLFRRSGDAGARAHATMLKVQTDLFVGAPNHSYASIGTFETFALATIPLVDEDSAAHVAERLAPCPDTPAAVIAALLARGGIVAARIAAGLPTLAEADMDAVAQSGVDVMAEGLALRSDLPDTVIGLLLSRGSPAIDRALAGNQRLRLPRLALDQLLAKARAEASLAHLLLRRADIGALDKAGLFPFADDPTKLEILIALAAIAHLMPAPAIPEREMHASLVDFARGRDEPRLRTAFKASAQISDAALARILADRSGESLAMLLISIGMNDEDAAAIFLSREPEISHSVARVFTLVDRVRYVDRTLAAMLIAAIDGRDALPVRAARHVPVSDPAQRPTIPGLPSRRTETGAPARPLTATIAPRQGG